MWVSVILPPLLLLVSWRSLLPWSLKGDTLLELATCVVPRNATTAAVHTTKMMLALETSRRSLCPHRPSNRRVIALSPEMVCASVRHRVSFENYSRYLVRYFWNISTSISRIFSGYISRCMCRFLHVAWFAAEISALLYDLSHDIEVKIRCYV